MRPCEFFIPGNVPSLKNSKVMVPGRGIFYSKQVRRYLSSLGISRYSISKKTVEHLKTKSPTFKNAFKRFKKKKGNLEISFHFVRLTRHKFDFHNIVQIIADLMVSYKFIEDDNMDFFIPSPLKKKGRWYSYDKENPGVYISIK